jgi:DNA repair ATPase RecN
VATRVVVKDIGALETFASQLGQAKGSLEAVSRQLQSALSQVRGQWDDQQREKCEAQVQQLQRQIRSFAADAEQQVAYCRRLASHLRSLPRS